MSNVDTDKKHFECTRCGRLSYDASDMSKFKYCNNHGKCEWKTNQPHWNNTLLGASVNLIGKGVKAGANKAAEYNSEEAKQLREQKKQEKVEERKIAEIEEKRQAGIRKEKADKYREESKPLTAFLVEMNPTYLGIVAALIGIALFIGGKKFGIFFVGGVVTLIVAFLGFVIKDFFKIEKKKGLIITLALICLAIGGTVGTYFYKINRKTNSSEVIESASLNEATSSTPKINIEEKQNEKAIKENEIKSENPPVVSNEININNVIGKWKGPFGKDQLTITIESIDEQGNVKGFDQVKDNVRALTGTQKGTIFTLNEPGDDNWDGVFVFEFDQKSNTLSGEWKANNGKSVKKFTVNKD